MWCSHCGVVIEADDFGLPPNEIRAEIIELTGRWGLQIMVESSKRLEACKILHAVLNTTMIEVTQMKDRMPGVVYTGTQKEMEWLRCRLMQFGITSKVAQQSDDILAQSIDIDRLNFFTFQDQKQQ